MKNKKQIKKEHFANLLIVAHADGKWKKEELDFLARRAQEFGIPDKDIKEMLDNLDQLQFSVPLNMQEREEQLTDAIYLSLIDGELAKEEYQICLLLAQRLGLDQKYLDNLIGLVRQLWENDKED